LELLRGRSRGALEWSHRHKRRNVARDDLVERAFKTAAAAEAEGDLETMRKRAYGLIRLECYERAWELRLRAADVASAKNLGGTKCGLRSEKARSGGADQRGCSQDAHDRLFQPCVLGEARREARKEHLPPYEKMN
jgi:hypothetical protein